MALTIQRTSTGILYVANDNNPINVDLPDYRIGAFGRIRVSNPTTEEDAQHQYGISPLYWNYLLSGAGTIYHEQNQSTVYMTVGTSAGDSVTYQTKRYHRYQPGKSLQIDMTGVMGQGKDGCVQRIGYFDDYNGIFFQLNGNQLSIVLRSSVTGATIDTQINQSEWNTDTMDGSGPSGITLDITKAQIFAMDLQWLGVGRVRVGFDIGGEMYYANIFTHANKVSTVYMATANLPVRYQILNSADTTSSTTLKVICASVISEGGFSAQRGFTHSANNGTTTVSITTRAVVLAIRPKTTFNGIVNRGMILPAEYQIANTSTGAVFYEVVVGGTIGGTPTWTSLGDNSILEYCVNGTTMTGGEIIDSGYIVQSSRSSDTSPLVDVLRDIPLTLDIDGANPDTLAIVCTSLGTSQSILASITCKEIY